MSRPFRAGWILVAWCLAAGISTAQPASDLPRYDLDIRLDPAQRLATVRQIVTWTNRSSKPVREIIFNSHARYTVPDKEIGLLAKMLEILRMAPSEALSFDGPALEVQKIRLLKGRRQSPEKEAVGASAADLPFTYPEDNPTSMVVALPREVAPGKTVTLEQHFTVRIPAKKGRWGQWNGVTTLAQWLPVVAVLDDAGWHPAPFIPWHQPFHNEAGHYNVRVTLPSDHKLACSGTVTETADAGDGWQTLIFAPTCVRDFSLIASARFQEYTGAAGKVNVRVLALPEHEWYAREIVKIVAEALPVYEKWFGAYPYPQFTVVESFFGWNGNECGSMVMIDERMFGMPHMARAYIDYLVSHELCHQWWYNVVGTNGYAETWMDEGLATYFSHRLINQKLGKDNNLLQFPRGLEWLPNIKRDDFRNTGLIGARARGEVDHATVQEMPKFKHLVNLSAYTYDRGNKIVGMIEERLGEQAMLDFMRRIYTKYQFRILRVADFQKELEEFTGRSWDDFFRHWVYSGAMCDWSIERVEIDDCAVRPSVLRRRCGQRDRVKVVVTLKQKGGFNEPTTVGFRFDGEEGYQLRIPVLAEAPVLDLPEHAARVECSACEQKEATVRIEIELPRAPRQISVDPDRVLLDQKPTNNHWNPEIRWRFAPIYTQIEESDVANSYHCWNAILGPWIYASAFNDPWYTRSPLIGAKAGVFRTQEFVGGAFLAYRSNDRNIIAGVDAIWDHCPLPNTQIGLSVEHSLNSIGEENFDCSRGVLYGRYILLPGSSLYLPPFEYIETFGTVQNRCLPKPRISPPGADPFDDRTGLGIHYHKNYMTPYWDAEAGYAFDISYQYGLPIFWADEDFHQVYGQAALVKKMPKMEWLGDGPVLDWLRDIRWAFRLAGAAALPDRGQFFALGGGEMFRGFDLSERQGSLLWVGSIECRIPIVQDVRWDVCDHLAGVRNVYFAPFYDIGNAYVLGDPLGPLAHAVGAGLRVDVAWLGLIERTVLRFDIAKTLNGDSPIQLWFGVQHPF